MSTVSSSQSVDASEALRYLPFLLLLFAASGCAALIYEIVWFQMLGLVIGSSGRSRWPCCWAPSWAACAWAAWRVPRLNIGVPWHPLRVYACIEGLIGLIGLAVLWGMPLVDQLYSVIATGGSLGIAVRA